MINTAIRIYNLHMLHQFITKSKENLLNEPPSKSYTFNIYVVARVYKILTQILKFHEDLQFDFREPLENLGNLIPEFPNLIRVAINNGLDVNWLINFEIPEDIEARVKGLRSQGFLK